MVCDGFGGFLWVSGGFGLWEEIVGIVPQL